MELLKRIWQKVLFEIFILPLISHSGLENINNLAIHNLKKIVIYKFKSIDSGEKQLQDIFCQNLSSFIFIILKHHTKKYSIFVMTSYNLMHAMWYPYSFDVQVLNVHSSRESYILIHRGLFSWLAFSFTLFWFAFTP